MPQTKFSDRDDEVLKHVFTEEEIKACADKMESLAGTIIQGKKWALDDLYAISIKVISVNEQGQLVVHDPQGFHSIKPLLEEAKRRVFGRRQNRAREMASMVDMSGHVGDM